MGKVTRKRYGAEFKCPGGDPRGTDAGVKHGVHQTMIVHWKRQAIEEMTASFS